MISSRSRRRTDRRLLELQRASSDRRNDFRLGNDWPIVDDDLQAAGTASGHYFHQDLLVAQEVHKRNPRRHIDIGSRIDGFVAHVAVFRQIEVLDIRPLISSTPNIRFVQADVMKSVPAEIHADSVSCLHALEHFGLGRYGDEVDYDGWFRGLKNIAGMVEPGGMFYLGVPTGWEQRIEFNAHRIFSLPYMRQVLNCWFDIESLAFVDDEGYLHVDVDPTGSKAEISFDAHMGCSIWTLKKRAPGDLLA